jgi:PERQ amino acid-rich with GYF domain-containing protein
MSMHFAPQWVKPIKPTGTPSATQESGSNPTSTAKAAATSQIPFPALSTSSNPHPSINPGTTTTPVNPGMTYSRVTHTPQSPGFPTDGSYFPNAEGGGANGGGGPKPHPFRYSRDQILALWEEDKVKDTPFELAEMLDNGGVLVSRAVAKPVGLRDLTETEKKVGSNINFVDLRKVEFH